MPINPDNDKAQVYPDRNGEYRWRRIDGDNGKVVCTSHDSYTHSGYAWKAAEAYCPGIPIELSDH